MIWVIDAPVAVRRFLKNESRPRADAVLKKIIDVPEQFAIPELFCFEVYAVLCRVHPTGHSVFVTGMIPLLNNGIFGQPMTEDHADLAGVFVKKGLTGYDACCAALAREMKGKWLTFDTKAHECLAKEKVSHLLTGGLPKNW